MLTIIIISVLVCVGIITCVLFLPEIKIGKLKFAPYWIVAILGAVAVVACGGITMGELWGHFTANTAVNPLKILGVFFGMTVLSVFLDEAGFFAYLASVALSKASKSQSKLFTVFYFTVAILTIFTSNDIIILTFTPFIIYFCRHAGINPKPYLIAEFAAANTFSMLLIIGNPTNIYLAAGADFLHYAAVMAIPAVLTGIVSFFLIRLLFRKSLREPLGEAGNIEPIKDKPLAFTALGLLVVCTVMLAISGYVGLEMWYIAVSGGAAIILFACIYGAIKRRFNYAISGFKRVPWQLAPFLLSMFTIVSALNGAGVTEAVGGFLNQGNFDILTYLVASTLGANLLNNIPMSVLFGAILEGASQRALFATVIGSNLGALLTPIGALAGIMWTKMLKKEEVVFGFKEFVRYGAIIVAAALPTAALGLYLSNVLFMR